MYRRSTLCYSGVLLCLSNVSQMLLLTKETKDHVIKYDVENIGIFTVTDIHSGRNVGKV